MTHSEELFARASIHLVGGAGAAGRINPALGRPLFVDRAEGPYLYDSDRKQYIDYHTSSGASLLGHKHPAIESAIRKALDMGFFCNYETEYHGLLAKKICDMVPCAEKVRFSNSGTEATQAAIRIARAHTGRSRILKFEGHFHGMHDYVFYNAQNTLPSIRPNGEVDLVHDSAGVPSLLDELITVIPFNDPDVFLDCMRRHKGEFAAVIMEPIMYNAGAIPASLDFARLVRQATRDDGAVLIFDEVLSGFRMSVGGGQEYLHVTPDLCTLGKALGCGMPIAAIAGKKEVMEALNPVGKTVVSGTYTGHLIEVLGALAALEELSKPGFYERFNDLSDYLYTSMNRIFQNHGIPAWVQGIGPRFGIHFGLERGPVTSFREAAARYNSDMNRRFIRLALERGLYFHDYGRSVSPRHCGFSSAHTREDIDETLNRIDDLCGSF